jgi:hypothetical protein
MATAASERRSVRFIGVPSVGWEGRGWFRTSGGLIAFHRPARAAPVPRTGTVAPTVAGPRAHVRNYPWNPGAGALACR